MFGFADDLGFSAAKLELVRSNDAKKSVTSNFIVVIILFNFEPELMGDLEKSKKAIDFPALLFSLSSLRSFATIVVAAKECRESKEHFSPFVIAASNC